MTGAGRYFGQQPIIDDQVGDNAAAVLPSSRFEDRFRTGGGAIRASGRSAAGRRTRTRVRRGCRAPRAPAGGPMPAPPGVSSRMPSPGARLSWATKACGRVRPPRRVTSRARPPTPPSNRPGAGVLVPWQSAETTMPSPRALISRAMPPPPPCREPRWSGMEWDVRGLFDRRPRLSNRPTEQSFLSLMLVEKDERTSACPMSSVMDSRRCRNTSMSTGSRDGRGGGGVMDRRPARRRARWCRTGPGSRSGAAGRAWSRSAPP